MQQPQLQPLHHLQGKELELGLLLDLVLDLDPGLEAMARVKKERQAIIIKLI
jgi:hypothetical protein